jgi:polyisoprenyl-phosphate glycosyltransferase
MNPPLISIIIPAYNEEAAISSVIQDIRQAMQKAELAYEILVVDDGSTDRTAEISRSEKARLLLMHRRSGVGAARTRGLRDAKGQVIVMIDGDGTYPAEEIPRLVRELDGCDMVIGARTREMGTLKFIRTPVKLFVKSLAEYLTRTKISDLNSGLRVFRREQALEFTYLLPHTHSWVSTITLAYLSNGLEIQFSPISYNRRIGRSTFHPIADTYNTMSLIGRTVMYFFPLRVFIPLSALLFVIGAVKSLHSYFFEVGKLQQADVIILIASIMVAVLGLLADLICLQGRRFHQDSWKKREHYEPDRIRTKN